jgi:hypothetical protein
MLTKLWPERIRKGPIWSHGTECECNRKKVLSMCEVLYTSAAARYMRFYVHSELNLTVIDLVKLKHVALILYFEVFRYTCFMPS